MQARSCTPTRALLSLGEDAPTASWQPSPESGGRLSFVTQTLAETDVANQSVKREEHRGLANPPESIHGREVKASGEDTGILPLLLFPCPGQCLASSSVGVHRGHLMHVRIQARPSS